MNVSENFTLDEATYSDTASRMGFHNTPTSYDLRTIRCTAMSMEHIRRLLGDNPVLVTSWYRSERLNKAVGGVPDSAHRLGYAVDFHCPGFGSIDDICHAINESCLQYDQLIWERGQWCHISFDPQMRRQNLTYDGADYKAGLP